jgi:hypothetical protein
MTGSLRFGIRIGGKARSQRQCGFVYHRIQERPYQPSLRRSLEMCSCLCNWAFLVSRKGQRIGWCQRQ